MYNFIKFYPRFVIKFRVGPKEKKTNKYLNNLNSSYYAHIIQQVIIYNYSAVYTAVYIT